MFKFEDSGRLSRLGGDALVFAGGLSFSPAVPKRAQR